MNAGGHLAGDPERIRAALNCIPADNRDTWLRMGMAVKSELGDAGFDVWDGWSQQADSYNAHDARAVWRSIRSNGKVTAGTLFHEAKANGWRDDGTHRSPTPDEIEARRRVAAERAAMDEAATACERADAATKAAAIWKAAQPAGANHPYLTRKRIAPVATLREIAADRAASILGYAPQARGEALSGRLLVVPVKVGARIASFEMIDEAGRKSALAGGAKGGGYWAAQAMPEGDGAGCTLLIGEGVATVAIGARSNRTPGVRGAILRQSCASSARHARTLPGGAAGRSWRTLGNGEAAAEQAARDCRRVARTAGLRGRPTRGRDRL